MDPDAVDALYPGDVNKVRAHFLPLVVLEEHGSGIISLAT
jgi:hypothetical protein